MKRWVFRVENFFHFALWMNLLTLTHKLLRVFCREKLENSLLQAGIELICEFPKQWLIVTKTSFDSFCLFGEFAKVFERQVWRVGVANLHSAARALAFKSESVFSIVNKCWQIFFFIAFFVLRCYNNFHQRQNATNISAFLSHGETLHCENKLAKKFW